MLVSHEFSNLLDKEKKEMVMDSSDKIRNIAIIAHVDHGKTTLVDGLLKQSHTFRENQAEMSQNLIMDSGDQEKERGITITAKITAVDWNGHRINIIDTPGHADFSGEVERTLRMADGCILVVDAQEGPMPQTKFVLSKALQLNLKPLLVINKIDKPAATIEKVEDEIANLFLELAISDDQLHYPTYYAVAREAKAWSKIPSTFEDSADLSVIFQAIIDNVPAPKVDQHGSMQMLVSSLRYDSFQGKYAVGRIERGSINKATPVILFTKEGQSTAKIDKIYRTMGLSNIELDSAIAGDIVSVTGIKDAHIGDTLADIENPEALPRIIVEAPTLRIYLGPNTSPMKGREGTYNTSRQIGDRLDKELETNVGLEVTTQGIGYLVAGKGELHLSVLIEAMRREGYEFEVGRPQVVTQEKDGIELEPIEEVTVEVPIEHAGAVQMEFGRRKANLIDQFSPQSNITKLVYKIPTRTLLGARNILLTATKGTIIMNTLMDSYAPTGDSLNQIRNGVLVAWESGTSTPYSLQNAEARGQLFVGPMQNIYAGQIVGLNTRGDDLDINVCKEKHLTNMRSSSSDGVVQLTPYTKLSLEESLDFIENDELLEVTPKNIRLRKKELDQQKRKRARKS